MALCDITVEPKGQYVFGLLQPVLFLPLVAPEILGIAAPALLINLLCSRGSTYHIQSYHAATITPIIFAAAIVGYTRLCRRIGASVSGVLLTNLGVWAAVGSWFLGPLGTRGAPLYPPVSAMEAVEIRKALSAIPACASVSAQSALVPHLSHRKEIYTFPNPFCQRAWGGTIQARREIEMDADALTPPARLEHGVSQAPVEYVALCPSTLRFPLSRETFDGFAIAVLQDPLYGIVSIGRSIVVLRRGADHHDGLYLLENISGVRITRDRDLEKALRSWMANQPMSP